MNANGRVSETLLASANSQDWVKISEMFLGPAPDSWNFLPKHKSNSFESQGWNQITVALQLYSICVYNGRCSKRLRGLHADCCRAVWVGQREHGRFWIVSFGADVRREFVKEYFGITPRSVLFLLLESCIFAKSGLTLTTSGQGIGVFRNDSGIARLYKRRYGPVPRCNPFLSLKTVSSDTCSEGWQRNRM